MKKLLLTFAFSFITLVCAMGAHAETPIVVKTKNTSVSAFTVKEYLIISKADAVTINEVKVNRKIQGVYGDFPEHPRNDMAELILPITLEFGQHVYFSKGTNEQILEIEVTTNLGKFVVTP